MLYNFIKLNYISYYKLNNKQNLKNIFFYFYILKKYNKISFIYFKLPKIKKYFCLVKSPKCYKTGKFLINYNIFKFFFQLNLKNSIIKYYNLLKYFYFIIREYSNYQTTFTKNIKITLKIKVEYNLKILGDTILYYYLYHL